MCTLLAPVIGYAKTVRQVAREKSGLSDAQLSEIFNLRALTEPGIRGKGGE